MWYRVWSGLIDVVVSIVLWVLRGPVWIAAPFWFGLVALLPLCFIWSERDPWYAAGIALGFFAGSVVTWAYTTSPPEGSEPVTLEQERSPRP